MDKIYLKRFVAYIINEHKDGYYLSDNRGYILKSEELLDIGKNLIKFAKKHNKDIEEHNREIEIEFENKMKDFIKEPKPKSKGYIYIMECGGKYKIGVSKDVERRKKELDNRPFAVNIIYKSPLIEDVYFEEKNLHYIFRNNNISGEWFDLDNKDINSIKDYLECSL